MPAELRTFTVNMKDLSQDIDDPIVQGAGDAGGRTFRVIFTQEAAEMFTTATKVYLKWKHMQLDVRGLNVFTKVSSIEDCFHPRIWEIKWPQAMLHEGDVLCCIQLVDDVSISVSANFTVHVLADPDTGDKFLVSDDYSCFKLATIEMNAFLGQTQEEWEKQQAEWENIKGEFDILKQDVEEAKKKADRAYDMAQDVLDKIEEKDTSRGIWMTEIQ